MFKFQGTEEYRNAVREFNPTFPHCYPMFAGMSSALMRAMSHALAGGFIQRTTYLNREYHDTGLGIMIWAAAGIEKELGWPNVHDALTCVTINATADGRGVKIYEKNWTGAMCIIMHAKPSNVLSYNATKLIFEGLDWAPAGWEEAIRNGTMVPDRPCAGTATRDNTGPYDILRVIAEQKADKKITAYLDDCMGLDRPAFHTKDSRFHTHTMLSPPPPSPKPPPLPPLPAVGRR